MISPRRMYMIMCIHYSYFIPIHIKVNMQRIKHQNRHQDKRARINDFITSPVLYIHKAY